MWWLHVLARTVNHPQFTSPSSRWSLSQLHRQEPSLPCPGLTDRNAARQKQAAIFIPLQRLKRPKRLKFQHVLFEIACTLHALHWQILHVPIQLALKGKGQPSNILLMSPSFSADAPWPALWIRNAKRSVCSVIGIHMDKFHSTRELNWFNPICILQISAVHVSSTSDCAMLKEPVLEA